MTERKRYSIDKGAVVLQIEASRLIAEQTAAFLKHGGQIQHIPNGVSGQHNLLGSQPINLAQEAAKP